MNTAKCLLENGHRSKFWSSGGVLALQTANKLGMQGSHWCLGGRDRDEIETCKSQDRDVKKKMFRDVPDRDVHDARQKSTRDIRLKLCIRF